jgi:hypothetical protein
MQVLFSHNYAAKLHKSFESSSPNDMYKMVQKDSLIKKNKG